MKTLHKLLWACCLTASLTACKDDTDTLLPPDELPPLPTDIITGDRAMWVSYDPTPDADANATTGIHGALVSWRMLPTDPANTAFDLYKSVNDGTETKLNAAPIADASCWLDETIDPAQTTRYRVTLANQSETLCAYTFTPQRARTFYYRIPVDDSRLPDPSLTYTIDDIQPADLDGDGVMELVVKREPYDGANQGGWHNGTTLLQAYKMDGTLLWQIDLGINIRSGSHYTSYIVYDFNGDGLPEIAFRSSEGTTFADGKAITNADGRVHDYRIRESNGAGWASGASLPTTCGLVFDGPEYISVCRAFDGREIARTDNIARGGSGSRKDRAQHWIDYWGDDYGNRMDRFFIGVAYLDGIPDPSTGVRTTNPSLIISRGIYKNWQVRALDLREDGLQTRWTFDTAEHSDKWLAMSSHAFRVADLDGDGRDEVLYGSAAIDDNGNELWCTGNGHGDCLSVGKFVKDREGLQIVASFEEPGNYAGQGHGYACQVIDARDGSLIAGHGAGDHGDVGRSIVADIDPDSPNFEYWSSINSGLYNCGGPSDAPVTADLPKGIGGGTMYNAAIYWSGELTRDLWDRGLIMSYRANPLTKRNRLVNFSTGYGSNQGNHSTKYNPCYYGDFLGDWREEVILGSEDNKSILVFSTNYPTHHRFTHLMEDHTYDLSQAMQNMGYNQQTNLGFYLGADMNR